MSGARSAFFTDWALANPSNRQILDRLPTLGLNQCYLVAGCLYQAVWNRLTGLPPAAMVKDYDVFYYDAADLSYEAEDRVIQHAAALFADLGVTIEIRNQARVHLWYERRFGVGYPALGSTRDGIDRYLVACTCVGIDADTRALYAPYGLDELWAGTLRMNPANPRPALFLQKAASYRRRWPWLTVIEP